MNATETPAIAIVGMSAIYPGSQNGNGFWRDILAGRDLVGPVPPEYWLLSDYHDPDPTAPDKTYAKRGAFLDPVSFDPLAFGIPPSLMESTDTAQLLALIVAQRVLEDATQGQLAGLDRERVSVILGVTSAQELLGDMVSRLQRPVWVKALRETGLPESEVEEACRRIAAHYVPWTEATFPGLLGNVVAGRIANRLDLHGTNCVTDAACASTFSALSMAVHELWAGSSDLVITGGVDTMNGIFMHMCFSKTPALSPSGECRPFDGEGDGTLLGEGLAMFALRRLDDAVRDGDRIHAVIRGVGSSSDGRAKSVYAPVSEGQARAIRRAYERAGYGPETVELVEGHGTGTKAGDAAELNGLKLAFGEAKRTDRPWVAVGSVKSQIGHTKAAAGAAGLFKAVMALKHGVLPPTIKVRKPNPAMLGEDSPLYLSAEARPWVRDEHHPRRAGVSSFGFGGSNFHIAVEAWHGAGASLRARTMAAELFVLADETAAGLATQATALAGELTSLDAFTYAAWSRATARPSGSHRLAVVAADAAAARSALTDAATRLTKSPGVAFQLPNGTSYGTGEPAGTVAFLFPGQGSQYPGMSAALTMAFPAAMQVWDRSATLGIGKDQPLHRVVFPIPALDDATREAHASRLTLTQHAQPGLGAASAAALVLLQQAGVQPAAVAGHSFGELTALHAAGSLTLDGLLQAAVARGEAMAAAASAPGAMCAVRGSIETVRTFLTESSSDLVVANHNHPEQVVLSGALKSVEAAMAALTQRGVSATRLDVATAFHSPIVAGASADLAAALADIPVRKPELPVFADATAQPYPSQPAKIRAQLAEQLTSPVRFVEVIEAMYAAGHRVFVEVGPQAVLTGLVDRILGDRPHRSIATDRKGKDGVVQMLTALGECFAAGVAVDVGALWVGFEQPDNPALRPAPKMSIPIAGWNVGRPYPPPGGAAALPGPNPPRPTQEVVVVEKIVQRFVEAPGAEPGAAAAVGPADGSWVYAFQEIQRQTAEAHAAYQDAMARSHEAYLGTVQQALAGLTGVPALPMTPAAPRPAPVFAAAAPPPPAPVYAAPTYAAAPAQVPAQAPRAAPPAASPVLQSPPSAPRPAPAVAAVPAGLDLSALLFEVVADKTGYPPEMLTLEMNLESDLGVDSIKRVEILSAVRERNPGLPEVDAGEMAKLSTLGEIVGYLGGSAAGAAAPSVKPVAAAPAAMVPAGLDLSALLFEVVADKTGYPPEMLTLEMNLESDLGVDSIKRVEILSAVRERNPGLPEVDAGEMAKLSTLGEIVGYLGGTSAGGSPSAPASVSPSPAAVVPAGLDLSALLFEVVADKTGYPPEMLTLEMNLESDLGVDSIKRVEILSAVRERNPGLPEVDAGEMAKLSTLGEIVGYLGGNASPAPPTPAPLQGGHGALGRFVVDAAPAAGSGLGLAGFLAGTVQIVGDPLGVGAALARAVKAVGGQAEVVQEAHGAPGALVWLGGLVPPSEPLAAADLCKQAFSAVKAVAPGMVAGGGVVVTVQDTGGRLGFDGAHATGGWAGGLPGLVKTFVLESPKVRGKAIDVAVGGRSADEVAAAILEEVLAGGPEVEVGLGADGARVVPTVTRVAAGTGALALGPTDVVLATGGARGVTAATMIALAKATRARFVLLGRTPLADEDPSLAAASTDAELKRALLAQATAKGEKVAPAALGRVVSGILAAREVRNTLAAIASVGGEAQYVAADVQDAAALRGVVEAVSQRWGPVTALVHGAGVLADRFVVDKTPEQFASVFDTKVRGLAALLAATSGSPLSAILLFSSVAARSGNTGQVDYAMANETLNKVAHAEAARRPGCVVRSLGWGPWQGGMVNAALEARFAELGVAMIPLDVGATMLVDELRQGSGSVELVMGAEPKGALLAEDATPAVEAVVNVSLQRWPWLNDHRVRGAVVVPVVGAVEWLARAAYAVRPDLVVSEVSKVEVLRGLRLPELDARDVSLTVRVRQVASGSVVQLAAELDDPSGRVAYRAEIRMVPALGVAPKAPAGPALPAWTGEIYDGDVLFHGPAFHGLSSLAVGATQATASVQGLSGLGWKGEGFRSDPAALDALLQLGVRWAAEALGGATLPLSVGAFVFYRTGPLVGSLRAVVTGSTAGKDQARFDAVLADAEGRVVARLDTVSVIRVPAAAAAVAPQSA